MFGILDFIVGKEYIFRIALMLSVVLLLAIGNILGRIYYNIGTKEEKFEWSRFFNGLLKALIVLAIVVVLTYSWMIFVYFGVVTDEIIDPSLVVMLAALAYFVILTNTLITIFGIQDKLKGFLERNT